jgi:hypothetical protein
MKFQLRTETIQVRGESILVRELTAGQKARWAEEAERNKFEIQYRLAALTSVDPPLTAEQAQELPSEVIEAICNCAMRLSGMDKEDPKKKPDVPGVVSVPSGPGLGAHTH